MPQGCTGKERICRAEGKATMRGIIVDIEGLDGSGKETQSKLLYDNMKELYPDRVKYVSFPDYESKSSALVSMYLGGEFGDDPKEINPYAVSSFFAVDRFSSYKKDWEKDYSQGKLIIANRYVCSNSLYQMPKLKKDKWNEYLTWLYDYEYNKLGLPVPDITFYLKVPIEVSQRLMDKRYSGDSSRKDLHESNVEFLNLCFDAAEYGAKNGKWKIVDCVKDNKLRTVEEIQKEILLSVRDIYQNS